MTVKYTASFSFYDAVLSLFIACLLYRFWFYLFFLCKNNLAFQKLKIIRVFILTFKRVLNFYLVHLGKKISRAKRIDPFRRAGPPRARHLSRYSFDKNLLRFLTIVFLLFLHRNGRMSVVKTEAFTVSISAENRIEQ